MGRFRVATRTRRDRRFSVMACASRLLADDVRVLGIAVGVQDEHGLSHLARLLVLHHAVEIAEFRFFAALDGPLDLARIVQRLLGLPDTVHFVIAAAAAEESEGDERNGESLDRRRTGRRDRRFSLCGRRDDTPVHTASRRRGK